ncbi:MerR family transcriptional regulator [Azospirillum sp. sgz302134]
MKTHGGAAKSATAFRTISEVSTELDVPQHVLRFWESKFPQIRPLKRGGGRRYYRPEDVELLRRIQRLLYSEGYTIKGVQRLLKEGRDDGAVLPEDADGLDEPGMVEPQRDEAPGHEADLPNSPDEPAPDSSPDAMSANPAALSEPARREIGLALDELKEMRALLQDLRKTIP